MATQEGRSAQHTFGMKGPVWTAVLRELDPSDVIHFRNFPKEFLLYLCVSSGNVAANAWGKKRIRLAKDPVSCGARKT